MIWKHFYPDCPYETFHKNWNSLVAEYRVGKAQNLYNKGKFNDTMTAVYTYSYLETHLSSPQVIEGTFEEESYHSLQDCNFDHKESDTFSVDLSDFVEEDKEELQALKDNAKQDMSSKKAAVCVHTTSKKSPKKDSIDDVTKRP